MQEPVILFRPDAENTEELNVAQQYFTVAENREHCHDNMVVGRYSVLPFYQALEEELQNRGCRLIQSYAQHQWIANFEYYELFKDVTPTTWTDHTIEAAPDGPFVLKGRCNSFKRKWSERMFASSKSDALEKAKKLRQHQAINQQGLLYRRFVPLQTFGTTEGGLPLANEWRFFFLGTQLIACGFYWTQVPISQRPKLENAALEFAQTCADRAHPHATFFVVDVAKTALGEWILIELNEGQTSGLNGVNANEFYRNLIGSIPQGKV